MDCSNEKMPSFTGLYLTMIAFAVGPVSLGYGIASHNIYSMIVGSFLFILNWRNLVLEAKIMINKAVINNIQSNINSITGKNEPMLK